MGHNVMADECIDTLGCLTKSHKVCLFHVDTKPDQSSALENDPLCLQLWSLQLCLVSWYQKWSEYLDSEMACRSWSSSMDPLWPSRTWLWPAPCISPTTSCRKRSAEPSFSSVRWRFWVFSCLFGQIQNFELVFTVLQSWKSSEKNASECDLIFIFCCFF